MKKGTLKINVDDWKKAVNGWKTEDELKKMSAAEKAAYQKALSEFQKKFYTQFDKDNPNPYTNNYQIYYYSDGRIEYKIVNDSSKKFSSLQDITQDDYDELMIYALNLINDARRQWGIKTDMISMRVDMNAAKDIAQSYSDKNWSIWNGKGHYVEAITKAAFKYWLDDYGENWGSGLSFYQDGKNVNVINIYKNRPEYGYFTMDMLKGNIYGDIMGMMFGDAGSAWGHLHNFIDETKRSVGLGIDSMGASHFFIHAGYTDGLTPDVTPIKGLETVSVQASNTALSEAQQDLARAKAKADQAKRELDAAEAKLSSAQTENSAAQTEYSNAVAKQAATNAAFKTAQSRIDASSRKLSASKAKNTELKKELDNLIKVQKEQEQKVEAAKNAKAAAELYLAKSKQEAETKKNALTKAQAELTAARTAQELTAENLKQATADVEAAGQKVEQAVASLAEIKAEIKQAETELQKTDDEIANFDALKKAATSKVEETSRALEAAKQKLEQKTAILEERQANLKQAERNLEQAKANLDFANKVLAEKQQALESAQNKLNALENADKLLEEAKKNLENARQEAANKQQAYEAALKKYNASLQELENAGKVLADAKQTAAQANRKLSTKQLEELVSAQQQILQSDNKKAYPALGAEENVPVAGLGFLAVLLSFFGLGEVKKKRA